MSDLGKEDLSFERFALVTSGAKEIEMWGIVRWAIREGIAAVL